MEYRSSFYLLAAILLSSVASGQMYGFGCNNHFARGHGYSIQGYQGYRDEDPSGHQYAMNNQFGYNQQGGQNYEDQMSQRVQELSQNKYRQRRSRDQVPDDKEELKMLANRGLNMLTSLLDEIMTCDPNSNGAQPVQRHFSRFGWTDVLTFTTPRYSYRFLTASRRDLREVRHRLWGIVRGLGLVFEKIKANYINKNVVTGDNNKVKGKDNFVVGDENDLKGRDNWIFASQISSENPLDGILVVDSYLVELTELLKRDARILNSISCSNPEQNRKRIHQWWRKVSAPHRFSCQ